MTDDELFATFGGEYGDDGYPVLKELDDEGPGFTTAEEAFRRHCQLNCITDPVEIGKLWDQEKHKWTRPNAN